MIEESIIELHETIASDESIKSTQFNLPPSDCRRHFNFISVVNESRRRALGFTWREIDYTFSSS